MPQQQKTAIAYYCNNSLLLGQYPAAMITCYCNCALTLKHITTKLDNINEKKYDDRQL